LPYLVRRGQRPDVAVNLLEYRPRLEKVIAPHADETERHGIVFTSASAATARSLSAGAW